jgi:hypothetical protein
LYNGGIIKPNQGIVGINRKDFKGYDEDFCGNYGKEDKLFLFSHGKITTSQTRIMCLSSATDHKYPRETTINQNLFNKKYPELKNGTYKNGERLRFAWEEISNG